MTASRPVLNRLLTLTAFTFLSTVAFSQAQPKQAQPKYDPATETTLKGIVEEEKLVPPSGGKPIVYLVLKSNPDTGEVFLCPKSFLDLVGVTFKADDAIEITGSKVKQDGAPLLLAREIVKSGETLTLRFKDGKPAW